MTARSTLVRSASAGTGSTATISKMQSFPQTGSCSPRSCGQTIKRDAESASHSSYQGQRTSATARTVPPSKSGRKPPSASAGNERQSLSHLVANRKAVPVSRFLKLQSRRNQGFSQVKTP